MENVSPCFDIQGLQKLPTIEPFRQRFVELEFRAVRLSELEIVTIEFGQTSRSQPVDRALDFRLAQRSIQATGEVAYQRRKVTAGVRFSPGTYFLNQISIHANPLTQYASILLASNTGVERYLMGISVSQKSSLNAVSRSFARYFQLPNCA